MLQKRKFVPIALTQIKADPLQWLLVKLSYLKQVFVTILTANEPTFDEFMYLRVYACIYIVLPVELELKLLIKAHIISKFYVKINPALMWQLRLAQDPVTLNE